MRRRAGCKTKKRGEKEGKKKVIEGIISIRSSRSPLSHPRSGSDSHATAIHDLAVAARAWPFARDVCRELGPARRQRCQTSSGGFSVYTNACLVLTGGRGPASPYTVWESVSCGAVTVCAVTVCAVNSLRCHKWRGVFSACEFECVLCLGFFVIGVVKCVLCRRTFSVLVGSSVVLSEKRIWVTVCVRQGLPRECAGEKKECGLSEKTVLGDCWHARFARMREEKQMTTVSGPGR